jgi:hypothetical protein
MSGSGATGTAPVSVLRKYRNLHAHDKRPCRWADAAEW